MAQEEGRYSRFLRDTGGAVTSDAVDLGNYYTKIEADAQLVDKSNSNHNHDLAYLSEIETGVLLAAKADKIDLEDYYDITETDIQLNLKADQIALDDHANNFNNPHGITIAQLGIGSVDNTADVSKPVSAATQTALNNKSNATHSHTKADVGLANVDNISDANKPISTAAQSAFNLKAPLASPTFTGTVNGITKTMIGLANADNTSDTNKPLSSAEIVALAGKSDITHTHSILPLVDYIQLADGTTAMDFGTNGTVKVGPTATATYTTTVPAVGKIVYLIILTLTNNARTITFGTGFKSAGTLNTGTNASRVFVFSFISDGINLYETSRTAAIVA